MICAISQTKNYLVSIASNHCAAPNRLHKSNPVPLALNEAEETLTFRSILDSNTVKQNWSENSSPLQCICHSLAKHTS